MVSQVRSGGVVTTALLVFILMFALDYVWADYVHAIGDSKALRASALSALLILLSGSVTIAYVENPWMLIPTVAGAFAGTYAAVWWKTRPR